MAATVDPSTYSAATTFGELGSKYEEAFDRVPVQVRSVEWIISQLPPKAKVVDVGCGTGKPACDMLVKAGLDVTGIDITPQMIEIAQTQVPGGRYEVADSRQWEPPSGNGSLNGVVSYFAFLAAVTQADIEKFFQRAYGWLRPGGVFVWGTVPVEGENVPLKWMGYEVIVSSLSAEANLEAIKKAGFTIEKHENEPYMPKGAEAGICKPEDVWEEDHLIVYCRKPST